MKKCLFIALLLTAVTISCTKKDEGNNLLAGYIDPADYATKPTNTKSFRIGDRNYTGTNINAIYSKYVYISTTPIVYEVIGTNNKHLPTPDFRFRMYRIVGFPGGAWTVKIIKAGVGYTFTVPESGVTIAKDVPSSGLCRITFTASGPNVPTVLIPTDNIDAQIYNY